MRALSLCILTDSRLIMACNSSSLSIPRDFSTSCSRERDNVLIEICKFTKLAFNLRNSSISRQVQSKVHIYLQFILLFCCYISMYCIYNGYFLSVYRCISSVTLCLCCFVRCVAMYEYQYKFKKSRDQRFTSEISLSCKSLVG